MKKKNSKARVRTLSVMTEQGGRRRRWRRSTESVQNWLVLF
jgi:hypothetical protein